MSALKENAITKLSTTTAVDMKTAASTALYTVPVGKTLIIDSIVVRSNSASLAGGTSYGATGWRASGIDLSGMTVTTGFRRLLSVDNTTYTPVASNAVCYWIVTTGSTAACTATIDLFGYLV
jgi:hypothetical protein